MSDGMPGSALDTRRSLLLLGRVAIVTGAGGGLGRAYALALAAEGAHVVVNDAGVSPDGQAPATHPASDVVAEIQQRGGTACANTDSVAEATGVDRLFALAHERFGQVDIVINNAGIVRSKALVDMGDDDWDAVINVHLRGTFLCCRAALRALHTNGGRIINVTSGAAFDTPYPSTANYAAAKGGIISLTRVVAVEGHPRSIACNAIAPIARTRMSAAFLAGDSDPTLEPASVAAFVATLASAPSDITGHIFRVARGEVSLVRIGTRSRSIPLVPATTEMLQGVRSLLESCDARG